VERSDEDELIVMTANFRATQNAGGLAWFLREVWSEELWGLVRLLLVGNDSIEVLERLRRRLTARNVFATGSVQSVYPVLARAKCAIVPLLQGSGTRLKCIEAMALGVPIVSTSKGCEGIEHEGHIRVADSAPEFREALLELLRGRAARADAGRQLRAVYLKRYSAEACAVLLQRALSNASRSA
jgi:glycosyltransferase involved in cell wall biosynthesis